MPRLRRLLVVGLFVPTCLVGLSPQRISAEPASDYRRIRFANDRIDEAFRFALERSPVFRALVTEIENTSEVVHVREGRCEGGAVRSCLQVISAGEARHVLIQIDPRVPLLAVVAQLAHELQHAAEVAEANVGDGAALRQLYARVGFRTCAGSVKECWETRKAQDTERQVVIEIQKHARSGIPATPPEYFGEWRLNADQSAFENVPAARSGTRLQADRGYGLVSIISDVEDASAERVRMAFVYRPDGRDYTLGDGSRRMIAFEIVDRLALAFVVKENDRVVSSGHIALTDSGETMTITTCGANQRGEPTRSVMVWSKSHGQELVRSKENQGVAHVPIQR